MIKIFVNFKWLHLDLKLTYRIAIYLWNLRQDILKNFINWIRIMGKNKYFLL